MGVFLFFYFSLYLFLCLYRFKWAVLLLLVSLPFYLVRFKLFGFPFTLLEGMILISFAVWFLSATRFRAFLKGEYGVRDYLKNSKKRSPYPFGKEIILLLLISFAAVAVGGFKLSALGLWRAYFFEPLLVFILILNVFPYRRDVWKPVAALCISGGIVAGLAVIQKLTGWMASPEYWGEGIVNRVTSFYSYPNAVGLYLAPLAVLAGGWSLHFWRYKGNGKIILAGLAITMLAIASLFFALSEGAIVGVAAGFVIFGLLSGKKGRWATVAVVTVAAAVICSYGPARQHAVEKVTFSGLSGEIRKIQWQNTWQMLQEEGRWLTGAGLDSYKANIKPYHREGFFFNKDNDPDFKRKIMLFDEGYKARYWQPLEVYLYPHNIFFNFWSELGLAGLLLFLWIFVKYFYYGIKSLSGEYRMAALALVGGMIALMVHGLVDVPYFKNDLAVQFWVFVAVLSIIYQRHGSKSDS